MLGIDAQLKTAYETQNMTPSEIAEVFEFEEGAVKARLLVVSSKFRKDCGNEEKVLVEGEDPTLNFDEEQLRQVNKVIYETALSAEHSDGTVDYKTRLAAAIYVREDKKGRKDVQKHLQNNQFNFFALNEQLAKAREISNNIVSKALPAPVDV